jgi:hypothetical protein
VSIPDPLGELRTLLLADATVSGLVVTRVYGGEIPEKSLDGMPMATVVLREAGGPGRRGFNLYRNTRVDTLCYAATILDASLLHRAVREVLETMNRPTGTIFSAEMTSDISTARDPVTQWPVGIASYLVMTATDP